MRKTWILAGIGSSLGAGLAASSGCGKALASESAKYPMPVTSSAGLEVTVYKDDFALVHDVRNLDLGLGSNQVRLGEVSRSLDPNSVTFDTPSGTQITSTTYDMGVQSNENLIQRLAGKPVELIWSSQDGKEGERLKGILEPAANGFLIRSGENVYINPPGTLVAPAGSDVASSPGLSVQLSTDKASSQPIGMSYLSRGMSWSADYVAHLDAEASTLKLECWASVQNGTGISYPNAKITFVAGSPNRAVRQPQDFRFKEKDREFAAAKAPMASEVQVAAPEAVGELYQYQATGPATLGVDQISRVRMIDAKTIPVRFDYSMRLPTLSPWYTPNAQGRIGAQLAVKFENREAAGLGMPLPAGAVRVYESDGASNRYTGADTLGDLPKDATAELTLSKVFNVYGEQITVKRQKVDKHTLRQTVRFTLHNAKGKDVLVRVVQAIDGGQWKVVSGERPEKLDISTSQWKVNVPANGVRTIEATFEQPI